MSLLVQRAKELKLKMTKRLQEMTARKLYEEECLKDINKSCEQELKHIDNEFEMLISHLVERKSSLKQEYKEICQSEIANLDSEAVKVDEFIKNMNTNVEGINTYTTKLGKYFF